MLTIEQAEHLAEVARWLDENVVSYPTPKTVTLSDFSVKWEEISGSFVLTLDGHLIEERFRFSLAQNGWVQYHLPMFISPLGAPASYGAIDLTDETSAAVSTALRLAFARFRPLGLDQSSGQFTSQAAPFTDRIVKGKEFNANKIKVSTPGFSITVEAGCVAR